MEEKLKEYGLTLRESDSQDRELIDFEICDDDDNVAWVWGGTPDDVEVECNHPYQCIEWGDDDERGECKLCGATCDWSYEEDDEGHKTKEPHTWHAPEKQGGIIGECLDNIRKLAENAKLV